MWFFRKRKAEPQQDGRSAETAFRLPPVGSGSAISIEYKTLGKLFGREGSDWRIHDRIRSQTESGRQIEKFILGTRDGRQVIYFDITDVLGTPDSEQVEEVIDGMLRRQKARLITVTLPKGPFFILYKIIDEVGDKFASEDFDAEEVMMALLTTMQGTDIDTADQYDVTLSVADWLHIGSITGLVNVPTVAGQEFVNDLRSYVQRALKEAGSG